MHRYNFVLITLSIIINFKSFLQSLIKKIHLYILNNTSIIARGISKNERGTSKNTCGISKNARGVSKNKYAVSLNRNEILCLNTLRLYEKAYEHKLLNTY